MEKLEGANAPDPTGLLERLKSRVVGHPQALEELVAALARRAAQLGTDKRPIGAFLLVGPTGSGKTVLAQRLAELVVGRPDALIRIDCAEFGASHEVAKLIGAPPGYLGHRETSALLSAQRLANGTRGDDAPFGRVSFVLFDEVDKAHEKVLDMLLGILDNGKLTLGDNTAVHFHNTLILLTANTGSKEVMEGLGAARLGFRSLLPVTDEDLVKAGTSAETAVRRSLRPEFLNRLDKVLVFSQLTESEVQEICQLELADLEERCLKGPSIGLTASGQVKEYLAHKGYDPRFGARHLKRIIIQEVERPIANLIVAGRIQRGQVVRVELGPDGGLEFYA